MASVPPLGPSGPTAPRYEVADAKMVKVYKAISSVYKKTVTPVQGHNFAGPAIGMIADHNSQFSQAVQLLTGYGGPSSSTPPPGLLTYNCLSKSAISLVEWGSESLKFVKSKFGYHMSWEDRLAYFQKSSYLAYTICSSMNLVKNVVSFFNQNTLSEQVSKTFTDIAQVSGSLLTIFSGIRAVFAIGEIFKAYQYKSLLGRAVLMSDKIKALKSLIYVSSTELFEALPEDLQERKKALKSYYDKKIPEVEKEALAIVGSPVTHVDIGGLIQGLASPSIQDLYERELGISKQLMEGLSSEELCGLILMKAEKTAKKREKLLDTIAGNPSSGKNLIEAIKTTTKVQALANPNFKHSENNQKIEEVFLQVQQMTNRKLLKESAVIVSCALTMIASILAITCPMAFPVIIAMWIVSNGIEFGVSLKEFSEAAKEKEHHLQKTYPQAATWKQWFSQIGSWSQDNWRTGVALAVNLIAIGLVVASLCITPITLPLIGVVIASLLAIGLYTYLNACLIHKKTCDNVVKMADRIDRFINKPIAGFFGINIDTEQQVKPVDRVLLTHTILSFTDDEKYNFFKNLVSETLLAEFDDFRTKKPKDKRSMIKNLDMQVGKLIKQDPEQLAVLYKAFKANQRHLHLENIETYKTA